MIRHEPHIAPIGPIQPQIINAKPGQRIVSQGLCDAAIPFDDGEIHHTSQQSPGNPRRSACAFRDFARAAIFGRCAQFTRIAADNFEQFVFGIKLQARGNAKAVTQGRC